MTRLELLRKLWQAGDIETIADLCDLYADKAADRAYERAIEECRLDEHDLRDKGNSHPKGSPTFETCHYAAMKIAQVRTKLERLLYTWRNDNSS